MYLKEDLGFERPSANPAPVECRHSDELAKCLHFQQPGGP